MALSVAIVGLANVGKSTIFNALTAAGAESANYPFSTTGTNMGVVPVPDDRLQEIRKYITTKEVIPATVDIVDIAGLVRGASMGEGLGNQFLATIRGTDAVLMVVRCFLDDDVVHVDGSVDPMRDVEVIGLELILADLDSLQKRLKKAQNLARGGKPDEVATARLMERAIALLDDGRPARDLEVDATDRERLRRLQLLSSKPVLYCCNVGEDDLPRGNAMSEQVVAHAASQGAESVVVCGRIEAELAGMEEPDRGEMLAAYGLEQPALHLLTRACYRLLGLHSYFTAGEQAIRAWTVPVGATAPRAARAIHRDLERGFIRAQVYTLDDLRQYQNEAAIKAAGKMKTEGKEYVVREGDIIYFLFNV